MEHKGTPKQQTNKKGELILGKGFGSFFERGTPSNQVELRALEDAVVSNQPSGRSNRFQTSYMPYCTGPAGSNVRERLKQTCMLVLATSQQRQQVTA